MTLYNITKGGFVELAEGFAPSFKKENALFAFDNMKCERTVSFDIPATPQNDRLFADAKNLNNRGGGMRVRYAAQLQSSLVTLDGDLYITEYENSAYKAVFVTGEMFGLRALKNAGKIKDFLEETDITTLTQNPVSPAVGKASKWSQIAYATETERVCASMRLVDIVRDACAQLSVPVALPTAVEYVRIVPKSMLSMQELTNTIKRTFLAPPSTTIYNNVNLVSVTKRSNFFNVSSAHAFRTITENTGGVDTTTIWLSNVRMLVPLQDLEITFPETLGNDVFCVTFPSTSPLNEVTFLGGYEFTLAPGKVITGTPLAGRSVTIPHGTPFVLVRYDEYHAVNNPGTPGVWYDAGWELTGDIEVEVTMQGAYETVGTGQVVALQDNLPDTDVVSLLKIVSALSGLQLYYEEGAGVSFVTGEKTGLVTLDGKIIERGNLTRTFADYCQKNVIQFDSEDGMPERDRVQLEYDVENENLAAEKVLLSIPYSEGISNGIYEGQRLIFTREAALADADTNAPAMVKVGLQPNKVLKSLCANSTSIQVRAKMSLLEYQQLRSTKYIYYNYAYWMWTDANWSKGVATISLSMVDDDVLPVPDVWLPFDGSYELKGNITSFPTNTDNNFVGIEQGLTLQSGGGAKVNSTVVTGSKGINLTDWNVTYDIFATTRTYAGQTIQATSLTVALWLRMDAADISSYGIDLSQERFGMIFGTPDAYEFFGLIFRTGDNALTPCFGNRNSQTHTLDSYGVMQFDVWAHYAYVVNLEDMSVTGYLNGVQVFRRTHPAFTNWIWVMQAPAWRMAGNYTAIRLPFWFKDVRLYNRALTAGQISKVYLGS